MGDNIIFDETWMRQRASDCRSTADGVRTLLGPADEAVGLIKRAANAWGFLSSLDEMRQRWEDLNKLLHDELNDSADKIDECAGNHGRHEDAIQKIIDVINLFD